MKICIKNATLVSMADNREHVEKGIDILIEEDKIVKIEKNIKVNGEVKILDATNKVVMPGLINAHSHVAMSIFRETLDGYNLQDWLTKKIWPMEEKLEEEDIYNASMLSFIEMIKTGCTTINDMYFMAEETIKAMKKAGIRLQTTRTLMDLDKAEAGIQRLDELKELIQKYRDNDKRLTVNVGIHGLYTSSGEYVEKCVDLAQKEGLPVHIHFCENKQEVKDIKEIHGLSHIQALKKYFSKAHTVLAHCVELSEKDILDLKDIDVSVVHCPVSNLKLGCGVAKISHMLKNNINVTLGTDGQGSGCNLDLFEEMKYAALLQKGMLENPELMPAYEVLKMATMNGAKALKLEKKIGSIEEGKEADLIIINMDNILLKPQNNLISELVYNVKGTDVETTIVSGNILMENRKLNINVNEKEIIDNCDKIIRRIYTN